MRLFWDLSKKADGCVLLGCENETNQRQTLLVTGTALLS
jgi:hypothetical protein